MMRVARGFKKASLSVAQWCELRLVYHVDCGLREHKLFYLIYIFSGKYLKNVFGMMSRGWLKNVPEGQS